MPSFTPALGQTSTIDLFPRDSPAASTSYIYLSFYATFSHDEDSSGSWEIWTDLPQTDDDGQIIAHGEWHTIHFQVYDGQVYPNSQSTHTSQPIVQGDRPLTYRATSSFPATPDQSYGYTFRRVFDSGETHWLGGEGSNGVISLRPMSEGDTRPVPELGSIEDVQGGRWEGLALELSSDGTPTLHTLPKPQTLSPVLTILTTTFPDHTARFSAVSSTKDGHFASPRRLHTLSIGKSLHPFQLEPNTFLSHDVSRQTGTKSFFFIESIITDAAAQELSPVSSYEAIGGSGYGAFYYSPSSAPVKYLAVYAAASVDERLLKVGPPETAADTALAVILSPGKSVYLRGNESQIPLSFQPGGTVAELFKTVEFSVLRGAGSGDSILICAPDATNIEDGEEEIDIPQVEAVSSEAPLSLRPPTPPAIVTEAADDDAPVTEFTEATPELEEPFDASSDVSHHDREITPAPPGLWFFKLIGRFLFGVLDWLITASKPKIDAIEASKAVSEDEADESEAMTPAESHSPDLPPTQIQRSSSGTFSNPSSPLLDTIKPLPLHHSIITPVAEITNPLESSRDDDAETITGGIVSIRSYTQFTFGKAPPFRFLLAPGTVGIGETLRFTLGRKGGQWVNVTPTVSPDHEGCVEVTVDGSVEGSGDWEVQVERT